MTEQELNELLAAGKLVGGTFNDQVANSRKMQERAYRNAVTPVDTSGLEKVGREREALGLEQQGQGIMLGTGPSWLAPMGQTAFRSGIEKQGPWEVGEGIYSQGSYTVDPFKRQTRLTKAMEGQATAQTGYGEAESQERGRVLSRAVQGQAMDLARRRDAREQAMHESTLEMGKIQKVKGQDGEEYLVRVTPTGYEVLGGGGAGGGNGTPRSAGGLSHDEMPLEAFPDRPAKAATAEGGQAAFNTERIVNAARTIGKAGQAGLPGPLASAIRAIPLVGDAQAGRDAANFASSAEQQQAYNSGRDMIDAILTLGTGAAFTNPQEVSTRMNLLPNITDKGDERKRKFAAMEEMMNAARNRAISGRSWTRAQEARLREAKTLLRGVYGVGGPTAAPGATQQSAPGQQPSRGANFYLEQAAKGG